MEVSLRFAAQADAAAMLALYTPYVEHTTASWEYTAPSLEEFRLRIAEREEQGFAWLLAQCGGEIVGYAYASRYSARRGYDWSCDVSIYVSPQAHRQGVARRLYTALLALLREQGYLNAYALVADSNEASRAFHIAMGFAAEAKLEHIGFKGGQWLGLYTYTYALNPLPTSPAPTRRVQELAPERVRQLLQAAP